MVYVARSPFRLQMDQRATRGYRYAKLSPLAAVPVLHLIPFVQSSVFACAGDNMDYLVQHRHHQRRTGLEVGECLREGEDG